MKHRNAVNVGEFRERRLARKANAELRGAHPLSKIDPARCHAWMREDCAQYDTAREAREDNLIGVIIQITSAALLAIPSLIFGLSKKFPDFSEAPFIHTGLAGLFLSLLLAMGEQLLSAHAYKRRRKIAIKYYQKKSDVVSDPVFAACTRWCRYSAYALFVLSLAVSAAAIASYEDSEDDRRSTAAASSPAAASSSPAAAAASSPAAAAASSPAAANR